MSALKILDFRDAGSGTLVKHSEHFLAQQCGNAPEKLGIIVGMEFFQDSAGTVICWPRVHWEGASTVCLCHPVNIKPAREVELPTIEMVE